MGKGKKRKAKGKNPVADAPSMSYADGGPFLTEPAQERTKETRLSLDLPAGLSPVQESDPNKLLPNRVAEAAP